jgi:hypothetical protein
MSHGDLPTRLFSVANTLASEAIANSTAKTNSEGLQGGSIINLGRPALPLLSSGFGSKAPYRRPYR